MPVSNTLLPLFQVYVPSNVSPSESVDEKSISIIALSVVVKINGEDVILSTVIVVVVVEPPPPPPVAGRGVDAIKVQL